MPSGDYDTRPGMRTPFVQAFSQFAKLDAMELGTRAVAGLLRKTGLDPCMVDEIMWGNVVVNTRSPNVAREISIALHWPKHIPGVTIGRACLSGLEAVVQAVRCIELGDADCIIAGGSDSTSNLELTMPRKFSHAMTKMARSRRSGIAPVAQFIRESGGPTQWLPLRPAVAERVTGRTMGYHADLMAAINGITREAQDTFTIQSHHRAAQAHKAGLLRDEIVPVELPDGTVIDRDTIVRAAPNPAKIAGLRPVFRKFTGTVTAASSSALTDGAACVLVMSEALARKLGYPTDISLASYALSAVDPYPQLLLAPALAIPAALDRAGVTMDDMDYVEVHEAFAAQVLATIACLESRAFSRRFLGRSEPVCTLKPERLNARGGSIAIGHPFAATGARIVASLVDQLRRGDKRHGLISICAAGGMGGVAVLTRTAPSNTPTLRPPAYPDSADGDSAGN